jgi:hypothetical protein
VFVKQVDADQYLKQLLKLDLPGIVPSPEILLHYKNIDAALPLLVVKAMEGQWVREYRYALSGQIAAALALLLISGGFIFLVMNGHERPAYVLLGAGVLNVIGGLLQARLRASDDKKPNHKELQTENPTEKTDE